VEAPIRQLQVLHDLVGDAVAHQVGHLAPIARPCHQPADDGADVVTQLFDVVIDCSESPPVMRTE
jgi:hypothetical protein